MEAVILVDENDNEIGQMEKLQAHRQGKLHRAFSVLIFNDAGELLIQQRAHSKYHSAGLWTNTCCSHPLPGETILDAAQRKLIQEMGFTCSVSVKNKFIYHCNFENGLKEHELDYVLTGLFNGSPEINLSEAQDYKWIALPDLKKSISEFPDLYSFWFKEIIIRFY